MRNLKIYICGPIAGYPNFNRAAFAEAEEFLIELGHHPVNPHRIPAYVHDGECPGGSKYYGHQTAGMHSSTCYMRTDIKHMMDCDAIFVLYGWEASIGGRLELMIAAQCGLTVYFQDDKVIPKAEE